MKKWACLITTILFVFSALSAYSYPVNVQACSGCCETDEDCNNLDKDYCDGDLIKHDEGRCIDYVCQAETTTTYCCSDDNHDYCKGTEIMHADYTCSDASCVLDQATTVKDCDDGLFCDGKETCDNAECVPGTTISCEDMVSCTVDKCNEETDSCDNTPDDALCDNGLYCDGEERCEIEHGCQAGIPVDCSWASIDPVAECFSDPDNNPFTFDFFPGFASECDEDTDLCTTGIINLTHTCDISGCGAECETRADCPANLTDDTCHYPASCESCSCVYVNESCPPPGTVAGNVCYYGTGECGVDGCEIQQCYLGDIDRCDPEWGCVEFEYACSDNDNDSYYAYDLIDCPYGNDCDDSDPGVHPGATEACNGLDDDCDGVADNITRSCYTGPEGTDGVGVCHNGMQACINGTWGDCIGQVIPGKEICNDGLDNDCDGLTDKNDADCKSYSGDGYYRGGGHYCGDGVCNLDENCSSCPEDCGVCAAEVLLEGCRPNWSCSDWSACQPEGVQARSCSDLNNCGTDEDKPGEIRHCIHATLCSEDWSCTGWSACQPDGTQTRTCSDASPCGTTKNKPAESQSCTYTPATPAGGGIPGISGFFVQNPAGVAGIVAVIIVILASLLYWKSRKGH